MTDNYDKVAFMLPMSGANNGTEFPDYSPVPKTVTRGGATLPTTVTAQSKYYGSSGYFPGNASAVQISRLQLTMPTAIGTSEFYIGAWVRRTSSGTNHFAVIADNRANSEFSALDSAAAGHFQLLIGDDDKPVFSYGSNFSTGVIRSADTVANNTWNHVAVSRDSLNVVRLFVNGEVKGSETITNDFDRVRVAIGGLALTFANPTDRYINDFLIVIGSSLHTANFTPPTRLIGTISNAAVGASKILDAAGVAAERTVIAVPRSAPVRTFSDVSNASGEFSIQAPAGVEHSVVALADEATLYNDIVHRVIPE